MYGTAGRTRSERDNLCRVLVLQFAEGDGDGTRCSANRGWEPTEQAHQQSEDDTGDKQTSGDAEGKRQVGESLPVHRASSEAIERENGETADGSANEGNEQSFDEERKNDSSGAETKSAHGGNFTAALGHRGIHGVERAEDRTYGHNGGDEST